ncbi:MAG: fibrobacter succinogenes major paralogous domain-containing protein [bacterium]
MSVSCKEDDGTKPTPAIPTVTTNSVSSITQTTAVSGGNVTSDGGAEITDRGLCWSLNTNPTIIDNKTTNGLGTGSFSSTLTGLTAATIYYVRAYATNSAGTGYGSSVSFLTLASLENTVTDIDGNVYNTINIGTQVWMAVNLRTTKYNDGQPIPNVISGSSWGTIKTPAYCWGNFNTAHRNLFGIWYNWYAVNTNKLAPEGCHIPTAAEWKTLQAYLGGEAVAGGKMKVTGTNFWGSPNTGATNSSGFSVYPVGYRNYDGYESNDPYWHASFWAVDEFNAEKAIGTRLVNDRQDFLVFDFGVSKNYGYSVRCIKNE